MKLAYVSSKGRAGVLGREEAEGLEWASLYVSVLAPKAAQCRYVCPECGGYLEG